MILILFFFFLQSKWKFYKISLCNINLLLTSISCTLTSNGNTSNFSVSPCERTWYHVTHSYELSISKYPLLSNLLKIIIISNYQNTFNSKIPIRRIKNIINFNLNFLFKKKKKLETLLYSRNIFFNLLSQFLKILPPILISLSDRKKKNEREVGSILPPPRKIGNIDRPAWNKFVFSHDRLAKCFHRLLDRWYGRECIGFTRRVELG